MWQMSTSVIETISRAAVIYGGLMILFRFAGKKQMGEMSAFDLVLLLIISESVSSSLNAQDTSLTTGLLSAATLILIGYFLDAIAYKSKKMEKLMEGEAKLIFANGKIRKNILAKERITEDELHETMRAHGIPSLQHIRYAVLESNGTISFIRKEPHKAQMQMDAGAESELGH